MSNLTVFVVAMAMGFMSIDAATFTYSYDPLNRLTNATYSDGSSEAYSYDSVGNRLSRATGSATILVDTNSPSVPTNLVELTLSSSQLSVGWSRSFDTGGSGLAGYEIFLNGTNVASTTATNFLLTGLQPGTQYCLTVAAYDQAGNISAACLPLCLISPGGPDHLPPILAVFSPTNNTVFFTNLIFVTGTATDAGQGGNGVSVITVNGVPAVGGTASGNATSQWSMAVTLVPGYNPFRIIAQDASTNQNSTTNDFLVIRAIPSDQPPAIVSGSVVSGGNFATTVAGNLGTTYGIWASTNLVNWILLGNVTLTNWVQQLTDADASNFVYRFYRYSLAAAPTSTNPMVIADGLNSPTSLFLDGTNLYFADNTTNDGIIKSVSTTGGPVATLFTGVGLFDYAYHGASDLQACNSMIYGDYGDYGTMNIFSGPETGGSLTALTPTTGGKFVCAIGTNVYFSSNYFYLCSMPITGGAATQLVSSNYIRNSTFDNGAIYFCDYRSRNVNKYTISTGTLTTLVTGNPSEVGVFIDDTNLYFNTEGSIDVVPKVGGTVSTLVSGTNANGYYSDGNLVYYTEGNFIKTIPVTGGVPSNMVSIPANSLSTIVGDGSFIYWNDLSGGLGAGKIWRMAKPTP